MLRLTSTMMERVREMARVERRSLTKQVELLLEKALEKEPVA